MDWLTENSFLTLTSLPRLLFYLPFAILTASPNATRSARSKCLSAKLTWLRPSKSGPKSQASKAKERYCSLLLFLLLLICLLFFFFFNTFLLTTTKFFLTSYHNLSSLSYFHYCWILRMVFNEERSKIIKLYHSK